MFSPLQLLCFALSLSPVPAACFSWIPLKTNLSLAFVATETWNDGKAVKFLAYKFYYRNLKTTKEKTKTINSKFHHVGRSPSFYMNNKLLFPAARHMTTHDSRILEFQIAENDVKSFRKCVRVKCLLCEWSNKCWTSGKFGITINERLVKYFFGSSFSPLSRTIKFLCV